MKGDRAHAVMTLIYSRQVCSVHCLTQLCQEYAVYQTDLISFIEYQRERDATPLHHAGKELTNIHMGIGEFSQQVSSILICADDVIFSSI